MEIRDCKSTEDELAVIESGVAVLKAAKSWWDGRV